MCGGTLKSTGIMLEKQDELDWQLVAEHHCEMLEWEHQQWLKNRC